MPLYEFECGRCGIRFEELVDAGTDTARCRACGAEGARRLLSPPGPSFQILKTGASMRRQEQRNAELRARTKAGFKQTRQRARSRRPGGQ